MLRAALSHHCYIVRSATSRCCSTQVLAAATPKESSHVDKVHVKSLDKTYNVDYKGIIAEEFSWEQYNEWMAKGWIKQDGQPTYRLASRAPFRDGVENTKIWQMHMQKQDGKPVWRKTLMDEYVIMLVIAMALLCGAITTYNFYLILVPEEKQNFGWKGFRNQKAFQRDSDNH